MALILKDRVQETSTTTGTGTLTLAGAVTEFQTFSSAIGNGNTTYYTIYVSGGTDWEVGLGTVGSGTLSRDTVYASSNAGSLVNFPAGTKYVFCDYPASKAVYADASNKLRVDGNPYIDLEDATGTTVAAGRMWYDNTLGSWNLGMGGGNITQQVGEELFVYGKASSTISDSPLQIVYQTGVVGASGQIQFAPTVAGITDGNLILGCATEPITSGNFGRITSYGLVHGITTNGTAYGETWADGDVIWYDPVTGNPTKNKPTAPNIKVQLGIITHAGNGGSGSFFVLINPGSVLGGTDSNVQLTSVANGNILTYDGGNNYWKNTALTAGTAISVSSSTNGVLTVTNTAPDQTVAISSGTGISVTGTYPNFTVTNTSPSSGGTVTSVAATVPSFLSVSGSPITSSGTLALTYSGTALPAANGGTGLTSPGTSGNVLTSNGSAWVSSAPAGGFTWQSVQTSNFTAAVGNGYPVNTTSASITVSLPSSATIGQQFALIDYAGTWATNNLVINLNGNKINGVSGTSYTLPLTTNRQSVNFVYIDSTQGWLASINDNNSFSPIAPVVSSVNYLVVAGGGGAQCGGGGAGGYRSGTLSVATSFTVTVGAGGTGGTQSNGSNSVFSSITSIGGGSTVVNGNGTSGGSGGGGDAADVFTSGGAGTSGQGYAGGSNGGTTSSPYPAGGGGGASAVGGDNSGTTCGNGGAGSSSSITGSSVTYAGGGGGCAYSGGTPGTGGAGGGGNGNNSGTGGAGTANTGGGGGGGGGRQGGNGGSGVVIIAYSSSYPDFTSIGGGLTYTKTTSGGNTIYKFTAGTGTVTI